MTDRILIDTPKEATDRSFGTVMTIAFLVLAVLFRSHLIPVIIFGAISLLCLALTVIKPEWLGGSRKIWLGFGAFLHKIISPLILFAIYVTMIVPIGLLMQIFRDPLNRKGKKFSDSYWKTIDENDHAPDMRRQF